MFADLGHFNIRAVQVMAKSAYEFFTSMFYITLNSASSFP